MNEVYICFTCKNPGHLAQTCRRDPEGDHKHYLRSDTLYPHLPPGKKDIRMTHCWMCKKSLTGNDQKPKPQNSHMILNEIHETKMSRK